MIDKFDKWDRKRVIGLIQETSGITLSAVGSRDIWFRDESGSEWWILGGKDDFHGIPREMMERESGGEPTGQLVFAQKLADSLNVYLGSVQPLVAAKHKLSRRKKDNAYLFNVVVRNDSMRIVEEPSVVLKKIGTIPHTDSDRESVKKFEDVMKQFGSMTPDEQTKFMEELKGRIEKDGSG